MLMKRSRLITAVVVILILSLMTLLRNGIYATEVSLYSDAVEKSPAKARPLNNLGDALRKAGNNREAAVYLERALAIEPKYADALNNLAMVYNSTGRKSEALGLLLDTLRIKPDHLQARHNLAISYYEAGLRTEAEKQYRIIIEIDPASKEAAFARSMLLMLQAGSRGQ